MYFMLNEYLSCLLCVIDKMMSFAILIKLMYARQ